MSAPLAHDRILALSYAFPPLAYPRAIQISRLLGAAGIEARMVCCDDPEARRDPTIYAGMPGHLAVTVVPFKPSSTVKLLRRICNRTGFRLPLQLPDYLVLWQQSAKKTLRSIMEEEQYKPTCFISFGMPMSDHLTGLWFKKRYGIPWIAHFSDPWVKNPFLKLSPLARMANQAMERHVIAMADCVVFTCEESRDLAMEGYPPSLRSKTRILSHSYDSTRYDAPERHGPEIILRHLGNFYGPRSPLPLFRGLARILQHSPRGLDNVRFELIGNNCYTTDTLKALQQLPVGLVTLREHVGYQESLDLMATADGLLVVDAPGERSPFFPSKLADYLGSGRLILGITPPGPSKRIIEATGGLTADPQNEGEVATAVETFLRRLNNSARSTDFPTSVLQYEVGAVAKVFGNIVQEFRSKT